MKKFLIYLLAILVALALVSCSKGEEEPEESEEEAQKRKEAKIEALIKSAGVDSVEYTVGEIEQYRYGSMAPVTAEVPNYTELFCAVYNEKNPEKALARMISKKEYTTVTYDGYANVTYETEEPTIHTDEIIKTFIDRELVKAINEVLRLDAEGVEE